MKRGRVVGALRLIRSEISHRIGSSRKFQELPFEPLQDSQSTLECEPGFYLEDQLSRVEKCGFNRSLESEVAKIKARSWTESPTYLCSLSDALVLGGEIFHGNQRYLMSRRSPFLALNREFHEFKEVRIPNSMQGLRYFGHWLGDDCPAYEVFARNAGPRISSMRRPHWADAAAYEAVFEQTWTDVDAFFAKSMTIVRELGFNLDKRARIEALRGRLRQKFRPNPGVVFIARGASGKQRSPSNQDELIHFLDREGVRIVFPEAGGQNLISQCADADVVITVEGSQACHAIYALRKGGSLLVLQPPDRFYNPHVEWTRLLGMGYGIVIGVPHVDGFRIEPGEVMRMLALLKSS